MKGKSRNKLKIFKVILTRKKMKANGSRRIVKIQMKSIRRII